MMTTLPTSEPTPVDTTRITVRVVSKELVRNLIEERHYLKKWSSSTICFGIFKDDGRFAGIDVQNPPIGVLVYGYPVRKGLAREISPLLKGDEVFELKRVWVEDGNGKNIESFVVAQSFRLLKIHCPQVKVLVSYADPAAGHKGLIYRATNWKYQEVNHGSAGKSAFALSLALNPDERDWLHSRTVVRWFGKHSLNLLKRKIGHDFLIRHDSQKYRYVYFLTVKSETKRLIKSLKHPLVPYKQELNHIGGVEEIKVCAEYRIERSFSE